MKFLLVFAALVSQLSAKTDPATMPHWWLVLHGDYARPGMMIEDEEDEQPAMPIVRPIPQITVSPALSSAVKTGAHVSVSPQGAEALRVLTGKRIKGIQILGVVIHCDAPLGQRCDLSGGDVYIGAARMGISYLLPDVAASVIQRTVDRNIWKTVLTLGTAALGEASMLSVLQLWIVPAVATKALTVAHNVGDTTSPFIRSQIPDPGPLLKGLIDPSMDISLSTGASRTGYLLVIFDKRTHAFELQL